MASPTHLRVCGSFGAAHFYGIAKPGEYFSDTLLPLCKQLLHQFISGDGVGGVRMDDGGLLVPAQDQRPTPMTGLRLNALWYSGIESIGGDLKTHANPVADHFERLAGRFRRSFSKAFWCDAHGRICSSDGRSGTPGENGSQNDEGPASEHGEFADPDQLLLTFLPGSPIPRTKQKQMLQQFKAKSMGRMGLKMMHPIHGVVESPMYLAWLAMGLRASADNEQIGMAEAGTVMEPLLRMREAGYLNGMPAYFRDGNPVEGEALSAVTTAEVAGVLNAMGVVTG